MVEAALYEKGTHPQFIWTKRWTTMNIVEIKHWASSEIKMIRITQEVGGTAYEVPVKRVIPQDGDMFERRWYSSGSQKSHTTAPYAISDMHSMGKTIMRFVHDNVAVTVRHNLDHGDQLLTPVYLIALELRSRAAVSQDVLVNLFQLTSMRPMRSDSSYETSCISGLPFVWNLDQTTSSEKRLSECNLSFKMLTIVLMENSKHPPPRPCGLIGS